MSGAVGQWACDSNLMIPQGGEKRNDHCKKCKKRNDHRKKCKKRNDHRKKCRKRKDHRKKCRKRNYHRKIMQKMINITLVKYVHCKQIDIGTKERIFEKSEK